jgi:DNA-directed RNA polymerase specialized sigma24 family protein
MIAPVDPAVLGEAEADALSDPELRDEERERARRAAESLARRLRDVEILNDLALTNFAGPGYEMFAAELCAYGYPVIMSWLRRGVIFKLCTEKGRPIMASDEERAELADSYEERLELAMETTARALNYFRQEVLLKGGWKLHGGATLTTYFVGACLLAFPNIYRQWQRQRQRWNAGQVRAQMNDPDASFFLNDRVGSDPAEEVIRQDVIVRALRSMPRQTMEAAALVLAGRSYEAAGEQLGISPRAVEGLLYRCRRELESRPVQWVGRRN